MVAAMPHDEQDPSRPANERPELRAADGGEPEAASSPLCGPFMSEAEWSSFGRDRTPANELLGLVTAELRTSLGSSDWTDGWTAGTTARFEWAGGPTLTHVLELLLPTLSDGTLLGVAGLRLHEREENWAIIHWLPMRPTRLYLTRLPARELGQVVA